MDYPDLVTASQPDALRAALAANADMLRRAAEEHQGGELASIRRAVYRGREIVVRTSYEITVDGQPFPVHLTVDNSGRVHYHGLPTRDFPSVIGLMKKVIDVFDDEFDEFAADRTDPPDGRAPHQPQNHDHPDGA